MFSIEDILRDKYPKITHNPLIFKAATGALRRLLHENECVQFEKDYPHLDGFDFVEAILEYFDFGYSVSSKEQDRIPSSGRVVIIANHPIGSLDGLALLQLVGQVRKDVKVVANELLMALKPLHSLLLPVNNMGGNTLKSNLKNINQHLESEGVVIIFPAGEVSRFGFSGVKDGTWQTGFLKIAKAGNAPVLPIFVDARNSLSFYLTSLIYKPMATLLLVREMMKQTKKTVPIRIGDIISVEQVKNKALTNREKTSLFRRHVYRIGKSKSGVFQTEAAIAHPEHPSQLWEALQKQELLGTTPDNKKIYLCRSLNDSVILREIGRLREVSFRAVGEGSGQKRDTDYYDRHYYHLVLWDHEVFEIVGAYRFCDTKVTLEKLGKEGLYTHTLFDFEDHMDNYLASALELGRSFVQPKYWGKRSLDYLWFGIGAFLKKNSEYRYLYGPVSISNQMPDTAKDLLIYFYKLYFSNSQHHVASSKKPYQLSKDVIDELKTTFTGDNYKQDFSQLKSLLANMGCSIPTLYKQYTELCEPGGVEFLDFGIDPDFAGCVDGLVLVDLHKIKERKRSRYMGGF